MFSPAELAALTDTERRALWQMEQRGARAAARESLSAYARYVFGLDPAPVHRLLVEGLEAVEAGELPRLVVILPPGHAKSTYTSIIFPSWYLGRHPHHSLACVTLTDPLAKLYDDAIANVLEWSDAHRAVFPTVFPEKARGWSHEGGRFLRVPNEPRDPGDKDPQLIYRGAGTGIVGRRANGAIIDDVVDLQIARSEMQLAQRVEWIQSNLLTRLQPETWAIAVGTLWGEGDVVDTLRQTGDWATIVVPAEHPGRQVWATVEIPDGVSWRPSGYQEGANE